MKNEIQHLFFDLDHTLWDFDKNSEIAFNKIFAKYHPTIDNRAFMQHYVPINQECWRLYQTDQITHEQLRYNRFKQTFDAINYTISDIQIEQLSVQYLLELPQSNHLFDCAIEVLDYLKPNYKLHIITNGFAQVQHLKMQNSGLLPYFETITNSEKAGVKKPNPAIFHHALQLANATVYNSIMIGDSYEADVLGAINAGIKPIFFNENRTPITDNILQIFHLSELKNIL